MSDLPTSDKPYMDLNLDAYLQVVTNATLSVAWMEAVDPHQAREIGRYLGSNTEPMPDEYLRRKFGDEVADLLLEAKALRLRFNKLATELGSKRNAITT